MTVPFVAAAESPCALPGALLKGLAQLRESAAIVGGAAASAGVDAPWVAAASFGEAGAAGVEVAGGDPAGGHWTVRARFA